MKIGIFTALFHDQPIEKALDFYDRLVNIPCSVGLTEDQLAEVVAVIRTCDSL